MHGMLREAEDGTVRPATREPAPAPARRAWRGFSAELADVLCVEWAGEGLPLQAREEFALVLSPSGAAMVDAQGRPRRVGPEEVGIARPGEMYALEGAGEVLLVDPAL